jgi:hypothetical protein
MPPTLRKKRPSKTRKNNNPTNPSDFRVGQHIVFYREANPLMLQQYDGENNAFVEMATATLPQFKSRHKSSLKPFVGRIVKPPKDISLDLFTFSVVFPKRPTKECVFVIERTPVRIDDVPQWIQHWDQCSPYATFEKKERGPGLSPNRIYKIMFVDSKKNTTYKRRTRRFTI